MKHNPNTLTGDNTPKTETIQLARKDELALEFVQSVQQSVQYWSRQLICGEACTLQERLSGLAFSILAEIDGDGASGMCLTLRAHDGPGRSVEISGKLHQLIGHLPNIDMP